LGKIHPKDTERTRKAMTENLVGMGEIINNLKISVCVPFGNCPYITLKRKG
jgi:hypothetical protein